VGRAGLLVSGDPASAIGLVMARDPDGGAAHIVRAALAPAHLATRVRLLRG
jgi:hypothetical protein